MPPRDVTADELRRRVHDDVGAVILHPDEGGGADRVVDDEGDTGVVGDVGHRADVEHLSDRVGDRLGEQQAGRGAHGVTPGREIVRIDERDVDAEVAEGVVEQVDGAAIERARRDDVAAAAGEREAGDGRRRLPGSDSRRGDAALEGRETLLEDRLGRCAVATVDVPGLAQREHLARVLEGRELIRRRLVDRRGHGVVRRAGGVPRVQLERRGGVGGACGRHVVHHTRWRPRRQGP